MHAAKAAGAQWSLASLSRALGRNAAYLHQYIHRQSPRRLPEADRHKLAHLLGISEAELRPTSDLALSALNEAARQPAPIAIPFIDIETAAGYASIIDETAEAVHKMWLFAPEILAQIQLTHEDNLRLIKVRGDSMSPLIEDRDVILIDTGDTDPQKTGVFVLDDGQGLVVKRLSLLTQTDEGDALAQPRLRIVSDNKAYVPYRRALGDVRIIGRVKWMSRQFIL